MQLSRLFGVPVACVSALFAVTTTHAEDFGDGRGSYEKFQCNECHGDQGQGGTPGGPRIASLNYPFEAFAARVRYTNIMPAYSPEVLGDEELRAIYEFIDSMPEPPDVEDIPMLSEALDDLDE